MEHVVDIDKAAGLCVVTTEGEGSVEGITAFLKDIVAHPDWTPGMAILLDHRKLSIRGIQASGIQAVSKFFISIAGQLGDGKLALVMNADIDFGIARAWEMVTGDEVDTRIHIFRSFDEARAWVTD